jgi:hypothetical protein
MNRHSVRLLVAAFAVAGLGGCFDDPTSSLREGPASLTLSRTSLVVVDGDSVLVEAFVRDAQGNALTAEGAQWGSDDGNVAGVALAATQTPANGSTRAYVQATNALGAVTYVRVTVRGLTDSIRVTSLPAVIPTGNVTVVGAATPDTASDGTAFTAGDTIEIRLPVSTLTFDAATSVVRFAGATAYTLFRSDTLLRVLARGPVNGSLRVINVIYAGALGSGAVVIDSIDTADLVQATRPRLRGTVSVTGDTISVTAAPGTNFVASGLDTTLVYVGAMRGRTIERTASLVRAIVPYTDSTPFTEGITVRKYQWDAGHLIDSVQNAADITVNRAYYTGGAAVAAGILLTVTPPTGMTFEIANADTNLRAGVKFGGVTPTRISRTTTQMQFSAPANYTGPVTVTNLNYGTYRVDSMVTAGSITIAPPLFTGTVVTTGSDLLDTITLNAPGGMAFETGASPSQVMSGGVPAIILSRTTAQMSVIASAPGAVSVTRINVGGTIFPSMNLSTPITVGSATGDPTEPANDAPGAVVVSLAGTSAGSPLWIIGAGDGHTGVGTDADDFYAFTLGATATVTLQLSFGGTGAGSATNPDFDLLACNAACSAFVGGFGGATAANPENLILTAIAAGTYNIYVNAWETGNQTRSWRLSAYAQ